MNKQIALASAIVGISIALVIFFVIDSTYNHSIFSIVGLLFTILSMVIYIVGKLKDKRST